MSVRRDRVFAVLRRLRALELDKAKQALSAATQAETAALLALHAAETMLGAETAHDALFHAAWVTQGNQQARQTRDFAAAAADHSQATRATLLACHAELESLEQMQADYRRVAVAARARLQDREVDDRGIVKISYANSASDR